MGRSLLYFWRMNLSVVLASAVASAVLAGALLVGDSVRGSLRDLTLERLGEIDQALVSESFFRQELAAQIRARLGPESGVDEVGAVILLQGAAVHPRTGARASAVNIQGVSEGFSSFFPATFAADGGLEEPLDFTPSPGQLYPSVVVSQHLLDELGAQRGDEIVLTLERPSEIPRESLLGSTDPTEVVESLRLTITRVLPDRGAGRFSLAPHQSLPPNAFVARSELQAALDQEGRVNALLVRRGEADGDAVGKLERGLKEAWSVEDLGLVIDEVGSYLHVASREIILKPRLAEALTRWGEENDVTVQPVLTYLANLIAAVKPVEGASAAIPYSTIAALPTAAGWPLGGLALVDGSPAPALAADEVLLNAWAAADLGVQVGDRVRVRYYEVGAREELLERETELVVRGVVAMEGLGADATLTPEFPGVHEASDMSEWNPPFPVDLDRVRPRDEEYWDAHRGTPKAFVALATGQRLWTSRFGSLTAMRLLVPSGRTAAELARTLRRGLVERVLPREVGFAVQDVKRQGLESASGAIDLGLYFLYFSFFLIVSAALLVFLFFRLGIEQRAREVGLLLAVGYAQRAVRRRFIAEGAVLAGLGTVLGLGGSVLYAGAMILGLRTWWVGAVGAPFLYLHVGPWSLVSGGLGAFAVVLFTLWSSLRRLGRLPAVGLLRGVTSELGKAAARGRSRWVALGALVVALGLLGVSAVLGLASSVALFFGVGAALLVAGLAAFGAWIGRPSQTGLRSGKIATVVGMAAKNAALHPGRSLLSGALVSSACFTIVAVGAHGLRFGDEVRRLDSGAGGYTLVGESDVPLHQDLNRQEGRDELGFSDGDSALLAAATIVPFRLRPGEDVSCLNLYQPTQPRILGVAPEQRRRGGFDFQDTVEEGGDNPWDLLVEDLGPGVVPAMGDANSMRYILKLGLGEDFVMANQSGEPIRLRLVGLLRRSLFQSELLISEENFLRHFPGESGYSYFLIDAPVEQVSALSLALERTLSRHGFDTTTSAQRLESFQAVENTYLATFQSLGGLGLLLGTVGLAVILLRNVMERRGELATLRALGFPRARLGWIVLAENSVILVLGLGVGTVSALVAVLPHLLETNALVPWSSLAITLLLILVVGTLASVAAVRQALDAPLLPALKED